MQRQVRVVRQQLLTLNDIIADVISRPPQQPINDTDYLDQLMAVNDTIQQLWNNASVYGILLLQSFSSILPPFRTYTVAWASETAVMRCRRGYRFTLPCDANERNLTYTCTTW